MCRQGKLADRTLRYLADRPSQVLLVRQKNTRLVYAMKVIVKRAVFAHQELKHTLVSPDHVLVCASN